MVYKNKLFTQLIDIAHFNVGKMKNNSIMNRRYVRLSTSKKILFHYIFIKGLL